MPNKELAAHIMNLEHGIKGNDSHSDEEPLGTIQN